jgi:hypothetical protein
MHSAAQERPKLCRPESLIDQRQIIEINNLYLHAPTETPHNPALPIIAKVDRAHGQQDAGSGGNSDHARDPDARTARNTAVNPVVSSMADTRTTAPASLISITGAADTARGVGADRLTSLTIGTKSGGADPVGCAASAFTS